METLKIINVLNDSRKKESKFEKETIKSSLCDYYDTFILVTGNITVTTNNNTDVASKNCALFSTCTAKINDIFLD